MNDDARLAARALPPPIYLHFLDRELGDAFEFTLDLRSAYRALSSLVLGTASTLVCSMSALLENDGLKGGEAMVGDLVAANVLLPQSTHPTFRDFLESRRVMYEHDQDRYPRYFGLEPLGALSDLVPRQVPGSTTERLHDRLLSWTGGESTILSTTSSLPRDVSARMLDAVTDQLNRREDRAVTYALFGGVAGNDRSGGVVERTVRQRISLEYTDHQRGEHVQLATGVGLALEPIERSLQRERPFERDVPILRVMLEYAGLTSLLEGWPRALWQLMLPLRGLTEHVGVVARIQWIARSLDASIPAHEARALRCQRAITAIKGAAPSLTSASDPEGTLVAAQSNLDGLAHQLGGQGLAPFLERFADALEPLKADILIIVATDVEQRETLREFGYPPGKSPRRHPHGQQIYLELDRISGQRIFLVRSGLGSGGPGGSQFTADDAIAHLRPSWVLMVGIAFGVDPAQQRIGDILVPTEVVLYDHKRIGTRGGDADIEYRDAPGIPDAALLARLRAAELDFGTATVRFGKLLSGSDLVDNDAHRRELVEGAAKGKAIGGEMELHGVFAAATRQQGRWAAAKAICDFADGRKGEDKEARQELAASNAARFIRHVIEAGLMGSPP